MANWYGSARSNYIRVKDQETFLAWVDSLPNVEVVDKDDRFALLVKGDGDGSWPSLRWDREDGEFDLGKV